MFTLVHLMIPSSGAHQFQLAAVSVGVGIPTIGDIPILPGIILILMEVGADTIAGIGMVTMTGTGMDTMAILTTILPPHFITDKGECFPPMGMEITVAFQE